MTRQMLLDLSFKYFFVSSDRSVLEVKVNGLPDGTPIGHIYHWLHYDHAKGQVSRLTFKSMGNEEERQFRTFEEGDLSFGKSEARLKLDLDDIECALGVRPPDTVTDDLIARVNDYLITDPGQ